MQKYKYKALNANGRPTRGVLNALSEPDLYQQLQKTGLELVSFSRLSDKTSRKRLFGNGVKTRDLIQFFIHVEQLESAGVPLLDALADVRDSADNPAMRDAVSEIFRDVTDGAKLSEAMGKHKTIFSGLYVSLIASGEETGKMQASYLQLLKYLRWLDEMQGRVRKATRYPTMLLIVIMLVVIVMMGFVVPQIVDFVKNMEFDLPFATVSLIATSEFFQSYWYVVVAVPVAAIMGVLALRRSSESFVRQTDKVAMQAPMFGELIRKINIARFCQTFGALYAAGLPILASLRSATQTVDNVVLAEALGQIHDRIKDGEPMSDAFNASGEFPSLVIRMLKVGESSGNLAGVLDQVSDFYTKDVDEEVQKMISMIEPSLTVLLGGMILWIAVGVFGPIYSSFENIQF